MARRTTPRPDDITITPNTEAPLNEVQPISASVIPIYTQQPKDQTSPAKAEKKNPKDARLDVRLSQELKNALSERAWQEHTDSATLVRRLIADYVFNN